MKEIGRIEKKENEKLIITIERCSSCNHSKNCNLIDKNYQIVINSPKNENFQIGDKVILEFPTPTYLKLLFLLFLFPIFILFVIYFLINTFTNNELLKILISLLGSAAIFFSLFIIKKYKKNNEIKCYKPNKNIIEHS